MADTIFADCSTADDPMALLGQVSSSGTTSPAALAQPQTEHRPVASLRPNPRNHGYFVESLSPTALAPLAASMATNGQTAPVVISQDGIIIDGERRWLAAQQLGWNQILVQVLPGDLSQDDFDDLVLDYCVASRQMSLAEQTRVYVGLIKRFQRQSGRAPGRPGKIIPNGNCFRTPEDMRDEAAKLARFTSSKQAIKAEAVFARATPEDQERVNKGKLSLTAAYEALPKRPRAATDSSVPPSSELATEDAEPSPTTTITADEGSSLKDPLEYDLNRAA